MGDAAGTPTPEQMTQIKAKVRTAMNAGTLGLATALIYPPGSFQTTDELVEIVKTAAPCNAIYATHMRDESEGLLDGIKEAIAIGEGAGVKVEIFHLKAAWAPKFGQLMPQAVKLINDARARGVDVAADMYPYPCRRHRSRDHRAQLGVREGLCRGDEAAQRPGAAREDEA